MSAVMASGQVLHLADDSQFMNGLVQHAAQGYAGGFAFQNNGNDGVNDRGVGHGLEVHMQAGVGDGVVLHFLEEGLHDLAVNVQGHQDMFGNGGSQHASEFAGVNLDIDVVKTGTVNHAGDQALAAELLQITGGRRLSFRP